MNYFVLIVIGVIILLGIGILLIDTNITGDAIDGHSEISSNVILTIANLPESNDLNFESYSEYVSYAEKTNTLIKILNEQTNWFDLIQLDSSHEAYLKLSKSIEDVDKQVTKWGPLVNNYNEVVRSAKIYQSNPSPEKKIDFYYSSTKFGFELAVIGGAVFYKASYQTVGTLYRASGLSSFARTCPSCVKKGLSFTHWEIRNELVEISSKIFDKIKSVDYNEDKLDKINLHALVQEIRVEFWSGIGFTLEQIEKGLVYAGDSWERLENSNEYEEIADFLNQSSDKIVKGVEKGISQTKEWLKNL